MLKVDPVFSVRVAPVVPIWIFPVPGCARKVPPFPVIAVLASEAVDATAKVPVVTIVGPV
jgi:hypothetical protein